MTHAWQRLFLILSLGLSAVACDDDCGALDANPAGDGGGDGDVDDGDAGDGDAAADGALEIIGRYENEFGGEEQVTETSWDFDYRVAEIVAYSNADNWVVTRRAEDDEEAPGTYDRLTYTEPMDGTFYYCPTEFSLESEAEAVSSTSDTLVDPDDLDEGCFGLPWSVLMRLD